MVKVICSLSAHVRVSSDGYCLFHRENNGRNHLLSLYVGRRFHIYIQGIITRVSCTLPLLIWCGYSITLHTLVSKHWQESHTRAWEAYWDSCSTKRSYSLTAYGLPSIMTKPSFYIFLLSSFCAPLNTRLSQRFQISSNVQKITVSAKPQFHYPILPVFSLEALSFSS